MSYTDRSFLAGQYATDERLRVRSETHRRYGRGPASLPRWVLAQLGAREGELVVDVACGPGSLYQPALRESGVRVVGVDMSAGMLRAAAATCLPVRGDAAALPLGTASCDRAMCNHALYHVPDRAAALRELRRVVRPGGRVVVTTNSRRTMAQLEAVRRGGHGSSPFALEDVALVEGVFGAVEVRELRGSLVFPDPEPVVRYVATTTSDAAELDAVRRRVAAIIARDGSFTVDTIAGCFVADV